MMHKTCSINYGHLADLQKTLPTNDLNKKNFHLIKYLLMTFIFFLSFQSVLVKIGNGMVEIKDGHSIFRCSHLHNGNSFIYKVAFLYWNSPPDACLGFPGGDTPWLPPGPYSLTTSDWDHQWPGSPLVTRALQKRPSHTSCL